MNAKKRIATVFCITLCMFVFSQGLHAAYVYVSTVTQEHSQWCWVASSKCIVGAKAGSYPSQCSLTNIGQNKSTCCNTSGTFYSHPCNQPGYDYQMQRILNAYGVGNSTYGKLTFGNIQYLINGNRPFIIGRSGHATVGYGYYGSSTIYVMDPWPGRGKLSYSYSYYASGWFLTIYTY